MTWSGRETDMLAYRDAGSIDPALYEGMTLDEVRTVLRDFAVLAGGERLRLYLGDALAMKPGWTCDAWLVDAYVENRISTVTLLRSLRESFAKPPEVSG